MKKTNHHLRHRKPKSNPCGANEGGGGGGGGGFAAVSTRSTPTSTDITENPAHAQQQSTPAPHKDSNSIIRNKSLPQSRFQWLWTMVVIPAILFLAGITAPFWIRGSINFVFLQRPDLVNGLLQRVLAVAGWPSPARLELLRPAVRQHEARQVLIVGTMSGGTTQVADDLWRFFGLEVCHETTDATRYFCRDGSVSWFHGIRFLSSSLPALSSASSTLDNAGAAAAAAAAAAAVELQCANITSNMGFHPQLFRDDANIACERFWMTMTTRPVWSDCWAQECRELVRQEWGCAWRKSGTTTTEAAVSSSSSSSSPSSSCPTPFVTVLHQVRHPLRTIESLLAKFCPNGQDMDPNFVKFPRAWFRKHTTSEYNDYDDDNDNDDSAFSSCLYSAALYVVRYHQTMQKAVRAGLIQHTFAVERTSPCRVAELAGFVGPETKLDEDDDAKGKSHPGGWKHRQDQRIRNTCFGSNYPNSTLPQHQFMTSKVHKRNRGSIRLTKKDFENDKATLHLWKDLVVLTEELGYPSLTEIDGAQGS